MEKQGLVNEAADYYLESLQRKTTNVDARIKLKEVGQKYVSHLSSEFFRNYTTQQLDASLETFERLKSFTSRCGQVNVVLDYPKSYEDDYKNAVENYCEKNYIQAYNLVNQKKFTEALSYIDKIKKYNQEYKNTSRLEMISVCEPLYQSAVIQLESKNYTAAFNLLMQIKNKNEDYKDAKDLLELASGQQQKSFMLFKPQNTNNAADKEIEELLFNRFNDASTTFNNAKIINNTPFLSIPDINNTNQSENIDLIQAIRKATGADFFYTYTISSKKEHDSGLQKTNAKAFLEVKTKKNDTLTITEYKPVDYNTVKAQRSFSYNLNYKLINAYTNQIVTSQSATISAKDAIEYNEFARKFEGNINHLYPYNPDQTAPAMRYNPNNWRRQFSANTNLRSFDELKNEAYSQSVNTYKNTVQNSIR